MLPKQNLEKKLGIKIATSGIMDNEIQLWLKMYQNEPPWKGGDEHIKCLNLPASISEELARLVLTEFTILVDGSPRANFINDQLNTMLGGMSNVVEMWCALGGIALKPYVSGENEATGQPEKICLDVTYASRFFPTAFNSNKEITGAVFIDSKRVGDYVYTRLEHHNLEGTHYTVKNRAFRSERLNSVTSEDDNMNVAQPFSEEVSLDAVEEWKALEPVVEMDGIDRPLFVYVKVPRANNRDLMSPLGVSVFSRATDLIEEADRQFSRILWEYEAKEAAIDADEALFDTDRKGNPILPHGRERLYRSYHFGSTNKQGFIEAFSPEIRDNPMFNGLNKLFRNIEFLCGLAYGTLSDVNVSANSEKTATEIKASKQRSYTTVNSLQKAWEDGLHSLIQVMDMICTLYNMAPMGEIETAITWGDGVLEDTDVEYQRRWQMVMAGKLKLSLFYSWYFGCTEEQAMEMIPEAQPVFPPEE